jgi:hypothetical protein
VVEEEEEDQDATINLDNSNELSEILSFEMDRMCIDSISNSEGSDGKGSGGGDVLRTRSGRVFGI